MHALKTSNLGVSITMVIFLFLPGCNDRDNPHSDVITVTQISESDREIWLTSLHDVEGVKYTWGGQSPEDEFDCSGLVVWLYRQIDCVHFLCHGDIVHDVTADSLYLYNSNQFYNMDDARTGDLVFFDADTDGIQEHVAVFVERDLEENVWVYDASTNPDGIEINAVSLRTLQDFDNKNPTFGKPMKTIIQ